jgi:pSer/pThr/pTyr-binding forkhead associated (FHA) protein
MTTAIATKGNNIVDSPEESLFTNMNPGLVAIHGPLSGQTFYLDKPVVSIGRQLSNDIILNDPHVSREHCLIRSEGEHYVIEDLNSANGTYVNGERVTVNSLREGSLIRLGDSLFLFRAQVPDKSLALNRNRTEFERRSSPFEESRLG